MGESGYGSSEAPVCLAVSTLCWFTVWKCPAFTHTLYSTAASVHHVPPARIYIYSLQLRLICSSF